MPVHEYEADYALDLVHRSGSRSPVVVRVRVRDYSEGGYRRRPCRVALEWRGYAHEATADTVYQAFQEVRLALEGLALTPYCYGSCPQTQLSGMAADMGDGTMAYFIEGGDRAPPRLVNIFEAEPDLPLGSVREQREFRAGRK